MTADAAGVTWEVESAVRQLLDVISAVTFEFRMTLERRRHAYPNLDDPSFDGLCILS